MKKDYIIPTIFFIKYEEESELLGNSIHDADSVPAASDVPDGNWMSGKTELHINNNGNNLSEGDYAKKTGWLFDDNAFSDSW